MGTKSRQMKAKEVLHYYIGQRGSLMVENYEAGKCELTGEVLHQVLSSDDKVSFILRLRPLSNITEKEENEIEGEFGSYGLGENYLTNALRSGTKYVKDIQIMPELFHYLLSHGFDLFGLIESGEAIKKEK